MSLEAEKLIGDAKCLSGEFNPHIIIEQLRGMGQHIMADLVESMNDENERLKFMLDNPRVQRRRRRK